MIEHKAPNVLNFTGNKTRPRLGIFGSIEQGKASLWQSKVLGFLKCYDIDVYNPRREFWDPTWEQTADNEQFKAQIEWELEVLTNVDVAIFYFEAETRSPVTLVEFGLSIPVNMGDTIVCCQDNYWRKGVIDITCKKFGIHQEKNLEDLVGYTIEMLKANYNLKLLANNQRIPVTPKVALQVGVDTIDVL